MNTPEYLRNVSSNSKNPKKKGVFVKKLFKLGFISVFSALIIFAGFFAGKFYKTIKNTLSENTTGGSPVLTTSDLDKIKLRGEGDGRINILAVGYGGEGHDGGFLTDTIMVGSIDPINKTASALSIPRDLWVKLPENDCLYGHSKINSIYPYVLGCEGEKEAERVLKETVGNLLDLDIHYVVKVDFEGFVNAIDELDGVKVCPENAIYDPYYPDNNYGYKTFSLSAGCQTLDGKTALKYARTRKTSSDFARASRQQEVIIAAKNKALETGNILNPVKISNLLDEFGDHVKTDFESIDEIMKLVNIGKDIDGSTVSTHVIDDYETKLVYSAGIDVGGGIISSVLMPNDPSGNEIKEFAHSIFEEPFLKKEDAKILILNGTTYTGLAGLMESKLDFYGYNISEIANSEMDFDETKMFVVREDNHRITIDLLEKRLGIILDKDPIRSTDTPPNFVLPEEIEDIPDIIIIAGEDFIDYAY